MKRYIYLILAGVTTGTAAFLLARAIIDVSAKGPEMYGRVRLGMSSEEIDAILGECDRGAQGAEAPQEEAVDMKYEAVKDISPDDLQPGKRKFWSGPDWSVMIQFGSDEKATATLLVLTQSATFYERLAWYARRYHRP